MQGNTRKCKDRQFIAIKLQIELQYILVTFREGYQATERAISLPSTMYCIPKIKLPSKVSKLSYL